jgi:hypothetical protein
MNAIKVDSRVARMRQAKTRHAARTPDSAALLRLDVRVGIRYLAVT